MTIYYIEDENGRVIGRFHGRERQLKTGHDATEVDSLNDLPDVDEWDDDYL